MPQRPKWLEGFFGSNLGFLNYEILAIQHFPRADLKREAELMGTKWFDYRRLHHLQATYYFVKCYNDAYQDFCRKAVDKARAPYIRAFKEFDFLEARERATINRLRQLVDRLGMRYEFFLRFAMNRFHRMNSAGSEHVYKNGKTRTDGGVVYPPRPGHMLVNEELIADAVIAWEAQCKAKLEVSCCPYYRASNFNGSRDQLAHEAWVVEQVKNRQNPRFTLTTALYRYDAVRVIEALRQFPQSLVNDAVKGFSIA